MCYIHFRNECVGMGTLVNGLFVLEIHESMRDGNANIATMSSRKHSCDIGMELKHLWPLKLGHIGERRINELAKRGFIDPIGSKPRSTCEYCLLENMAKQSFVGKSGRVDVCGPFSIMARGGYSYFITFTNEFLRYEYMYLMKYKSKALEKFKELWQKWRTRLEKILRYFDLIVVGNT